MFVRSAGERDLAAIHELLVETWHATYDVIYGRERVNEITGEWHSIPALKARLTRPNSEFVVVDDGERICAMAFAAATSDGKTVILQQLYVRTDCQRRGIGRMLLDEIEDCFPDARLIRLEVEPANAQALAFYEANGFRAIGDAEADATGVASLLLEKHLA
ncbi:ribosomal protein S18 acetylase RimI-like enzyme [Pseudaminobacter salicylatoxidans]|uniref:Ribosomal protein S18 acetylase RimI-like enzyme n=1 Tax=Pseudaminobacter salicylatoxidans TaxID=93369 RepID=A0A316BYJ0_PSESE|nr:GNAT family N-acetyltransferase [Pseudaminobacter salicylatoxidans]PWJ79485.1 ribosomal protein S18 acetylase RimI-like enzyme [Pseudaminobacter salicylatoxidans]